MSISQWIIVDETPYINSFNEITYSVIKPEDKKFDDCYIVNISVKEPLKFDQVTDLFDALELATHILVQTEKPKPETCVFIIVDLNPGIKFTPDINMSIKYVQCIDKIEEETKLKMRGLVIIGEKGSRSLEKLDFAVNFFARNLNIQVTASYTEAYEIILKYIASS